MFTLKVARTDKGFVTHKFTDLRACFACLDMLRSAGKVRRAWILHRGSAVKYGASSPWINATWTRDEGVDQVPFSHLWNGLIYSN